MIQARPVRRKINGVLLLDKPPMISSNAALQAAKRLFCASKAGHTGTLDPIATGLLPICFGEATKFAAALLEADKTYQAVIKLGQTTTTGDSEGEIVSSREAKASPAQIEQALQRFVGKIRQTPPMHSAIKHAGKPLYSYIRKGLEVARQSREVTIHSLRLDDFRQDELSVTITCSKGTYIRVLAEEIGSILECGAHLKALRREAIGDLVLSDAYTLRQLEALAPERRDQCLRPVDSLLQKFPEVLLDVESSRCLLQGREVRNAMVAMAGKVRLYDARRRFLGIGEINLGGNIMPKRLVAPENS